MKCPRSDSCHNLRTWWTWNKGVVKSGAPSTQLWLLGNGERGKINYQSKTSMLIEIGLWLRTQNADQMPTHSQIGLTPSLCPHVNTKLKKSLLSSRPGWCFREALVSLVSLLELSTFSQKLFPKAVYTDVFNDLTFGDANPASGLLFPSTGPAVFLEYPGVPSLSLVASAWHDE